MRDGGAMRGDDEISGSLFSYIDPLPCSLKGKEGNWATIRHGPLRAQQGQRVIVTRSFGELPRQCRIIDRQQLAGWRLDIQSEVCGISSDGVEEGREGFRFGKVGRLGRSLQVAEARPVEQHVMLLSPREVRKS